MTLRDLKLLPAYESHKNDLVGEFLIPTLSEASEYRRIAGYFSSTSLAIAAKGIGRFIENGGKIKMIACPHLSDNDIFAINDASKHPEKHLSFLLKQGIEDFEDEFQQDHVAALGWMIASGNLELRIAVGFSNGEFNNENLFHQKVGILQDSDKNLITFSGSTNETASGWLNNVEEFKVFKNWHEADRQWLESDTQKFDEFWDNRRSYVKTMALPSAVRKKLIEYGQDFTVDKIAAKKYIERQKSILENAGISLFSYQKEAVEQWDKSGRKMLFEMATGTGKTRTAIAAISKVLNENNPTLAVISTPQVTLSRQWEQSFDDLGITFDTVVYADGTNVKWEDKLVSTLLDLEIGFVKNAVVYTTHATSSKTKFIDKITSSSCLITTIFVGDETHALGSKKQRCALLERYDFRIGLSATPSRWFDDEGSSLIREYYGSSSFEFSIHDALNTINPLTGESFLTPYKYHPLVIHLDSQEMDEYLELSKKISKMFLSGCSKENSEGNDAYQNLLFIRANILKNATAKMSAFLSKLKKDMRRTLIFTSSEQLEEVLLLLKQNRIIAHRFTEKQGTRPNKEYNGLSERQYLINCFTKEDIHCLVAISCLDEGIDIPSADTAFLLSNSTNPREYIQRIGRVIRRSPNKTIAHIYDFIAIPLFNPFDESTNEVEKRILEKECSRINEMANNAENVREITAVVTSIWEEFYRGT